MAVFGRSEPEVTYTEAIARGGSLLNETHALLPAWRQGEAPAAFIKRVQQEDILGKATARTVRDYVWMFGRRFLAPDDTPARHLHQLAASGAPRKTMNDIILYYYAQRDDLVRDFIVHCYWPAMREGRTILARDDAMRFLWQAEQDGRIRKPWSEKVRYDMPARILRFLSDFGFLGPLQAHGREILNYRVADGAVVYLTYLLHFQGISDGLLAQHRVWSLYGLSSQNVLGRLDVLTGDGWFVLQRAGSVVQLTWQYDTIEEVLNGIARRGLPTASGAG